MIVPWNLDLNFKFLEDFKKDKKFDELSLTKYWWYLEAKITNDFNGFIHFNEYGTPEYVTFSKEEDAILFLLSI